MHFRNVQTQGKKDELDLPNAPFQAKFLEALTTDWPRGQWSV
jgi:hypothetical protein